MVPHIDEGSLAQVLPAAAFERASEGLRQFESEFIRKADYEGY